MSNDDFRKKIVEAVHASRIEFTNNPDEANLMSILASLRDVGVPQDELDEFERSWRILADRSASGEGSLGRYRGH